MQVKATTFDSNDWDEICVIDKEIEIRAWKSQIEDERDVDSSGLLRWLTLLFEDFESLEKNYVQVLVQLIGNWTHYLFGLKDPNSILSLWLV